MLSINLNSFHFAFQHIIQHSLLSYVILTLISVDGFPHLCAAAVAFLYYLTSLVMTHINLQIQEESLSLLDCQEIINRFFWLMSWQPDQSDATKKHLHNEWPMIEKMLQIK